MRFHILQRHKICFLRCCFLLSFKPTTTPSPPTRPRRHKAEASEASSLERERMGEAETDSSCLFGAFIEEATNLFK